ncbi:sugar phosphate nucleotidyltransferase [Candidatus Nanohalococcus occultus]|uniref:Mannose-1-phosphate guanylyltransferase n=1 Tax=Candidatus Nanohalococcus occultus TaxID=2978047 RepID=A0ABY8CFS7_9ARCH|nr:Mannose-1-phosphate guanylyltransferase [Candidatus Nanohaloarchaeota archaeon SVXNc]
MSKKRVSLTLEESLVDRLDAEAERKSHNRSQTVEEILSKYFDAQGLDTAVILCGDPELKSLELYNGRSILSNILENLSGQGIRRVVLLTGKNKERIRKEFGKSYEGISIEYVEDESVSGTAAALEKLEAELTSSFLVVNGHVIADVDLDEMYRFHRSNESVATMALTTVEDPSRYGVARLKGRKVIGFEEKPEPGKEPSRLINAGRYVLDPEIFEHLSSEDLETVFESLAKSGRLSGYIYGGEWKDVS